ncbi:MAG: chemotaxis protein CheD [Planctomycetes bacterium]|nr:chemotaxis protein CheD [Planctomycetota bacterium]
MENQEYLPTQFFLKPGYAMAHDEASIIRTVLGNCVAVTFFDRSNCFGGMNQFVFPKTDRREDMTTQYGNVGIRALFRMLLDMGAHRSDIVAQIVGGAECRIFNDDSLGLKNINLARILLEKLGVPVISEDVGGSMGRKVIYHTGTNEMAVFKVDSLRRNDWFKPGMDLRYDFADCR